VPAEPLDLFRRMAAGEDTLVSRLVSRRARLRHDPEWTVLHRARGGLGSFFRQQLRRGYSGAVLAVLFREKAPLKRPGYRWFLATRLGGTAAFWGLIAAAPVLGWSLAGVGVGLFLLSHLDLWRLLYRKEGFSRPLWLGPVTALVRGTAWLAGGVFGVLTARRRLDSLTLRKG
jgi:hypothetical protein